MNVCVCVLLLFFGFVKFPSLYSDKVIVCNEISETCLEGLVSKTFQEVKVGEVLIYINSFGFLEVAINQGNASKKLKAKIGDTMTIESV